MTPLVWTNGSVMALNKPPGLPVFPPHKDPDGDCLLARWLAVHPGLSDVDWPEGFAGGIAHRLDVPTSGQVIAAADTAALAELRSLFSTGQLTKVYRFVASGDVPWDTHTVTQRIAHDRKRRSRMVVERGRATPVSYTHLTLPTIYSV